MAYKNLNNFIEILEQNDELHRVKTKVSPELEMTEINDRLVKNSGKALLFENNGTEFPVLLNAMGSDKRICLALNVNDLDEIGNNIKGIFESLTSPKDSVLDKLKFLPKMKEISDWMPSRSDKSGNCQKNSIAEVDLDKLPILKCWPHDGGKFITFPVVHTKSLKTGAPNIGMYRMQQLSKTETAMHWHLHKDGASHFKEYKEAGKKMPITVTLGGDPAYTYAATAPMPENIDEYMLAGFLRKKKVKLVKSKTNDIYIPDDVDIVLEGYVDPNEAFAWEGPFGDHTGYYSLADYFPKFHIEKITYKDKAVFPATIVGIPPQEDAWMGLATERIFLSPIKMTMVPEIEDMHMPLEGVFHNIVLTSIDNSFPGNADKVINALWGAGQMMFNKLMFIFDKNVNLKDYKSVAKLISKNINPLSDINFGKGPLDILDHSSQKYAVGGKCGFDATEKNYEFNNDYKVEADKILEISEIEDLNTALLKEEISILILKYKKTKDSSTRFIAKKIMDNNFVSNVKFIVFVEEKAIIDDYSDVVWRVANNVDTARDFFFVNDDKFKMYNTLFIDGTRKYKLFDGFQRDWPNIVCMNKATIDLVDEKWSEYNIGEMIKSPSLKYIDLLYPGDAVAEEE